MYTEVRQKSVEEKWFRSNFLFCIIQYAIWQYGFQVSKGGIQNKISLWPNQHTQVKLLYFVNRGSAELSKSLKNLTFKVNFLCKNDLDLSIVFIEQYQFRITFFY